MKTSETIKAIHQASLGGSYFDKRAFLEAVGVGCLFGLATEACLHIENPLLRLIPFIPVTALILWKRNALKGWRRFSHPIGIQYSTQVFQIIYSVIVGSATLLVVYLSEYLWQFIF